MDIIQIREYKASDKEQLVVLFENFQDYLVSIDPLKRLTSIEGSGEKVLDKNLHYVRDKDGIWGMRFSERNGFVYAYLVDLTGLSGEHQNWWYDHLIEKD